MDLFEILLILFFVVLPLLQQFLGRKDGEGEGEPDLEAEEAPPERERVARRTPGVEVGTAPAPPPRQTPPEPQARSGGWSADWGEWPTADEEAAADEITGEEIHAEELSLERASAEHQDVRRARAPEVPEVVRDATTVVSLEPLHVNRAAEHARLHARTSEPLASARRPPARLSGLLGDHHELRRAILLAEVVGPPAALRGPPGPEV